MHVKMRVGVWKRFDVERMVRGETQAELAKRLGGVSQTYYSQVSRGKIVPSLAFLNALLTLFPEFYDDFLTMYIVQPNAQAAEE